MARRPSPKLAAAALLLGRAKSAEQAALGREYIAQNVLREPVGFTDRFGIQVLLYPSDNLYDRYVHRGYNEVREQDFTARYLKPGMTTVDVGANYGLYSLMFAKLAGPEGVHAFEAEAWNHQRLLVNLALNGWAAGPHVHLAAVADQSGTVELNVFPREEFGWHTIGKPEMELHGQPYHPEETRTVPAVSLDDYCSEQGIDRIDFLKVDVEGAEPEVFAGAAALFAERRVGCVLFEVSEQMLAGLGHTGAEVFEQLRGWGYAIEAFAEDGSLVPAPDAPGQTYENFIARP
ncbi:MAG: putative methyltransferase [Solirubrobacterales bacterium]|jgi:FkbM family methyltransferase|nr:putative methyltransferase [Solirubrobacterales bacterium]